MLATARLGLGTVAAFTSDLKGRWTGDWLGWPGFGKLVVQLTRAVARGAESGGVAARVEIADGGARVVVVDANDAGGRFVDGAVVEVTRLVDGRTMRAEQVEPGRYAAEFAGGGEAFSVRVGDGTPVAVMRDPALTRGREGAKLEGGGGEFAVLADVEPGVARLAMAGGGIVDPGVKAVMRPTGVIVAKTTDLSIWFLMAALVMLPFDVWVRRRGVA